MLDIQKQYNDEYIVYEFIGAINKKVDLERVKEMLREDISQTYAFIFSFKHLNYIDSQAIKMLQEIYLFGVKNTCEMIISGLNPQPSMMLEIFQVDKIYTITKRLQDAQEMFYGADYELTYNS